ncbi:hypothetical protein SARC_17227 [Sphaeroforma arctica JP610]|uniref:C2H2-type domain-containing protein n=1 Tax=Sphaeroforma arctica JP610 TaxID=667725 RepID=A0A0L0F247_9EUKA|nr:hypothetical protein SARC_17227 [Sphaeroforma arctica JP610]KNC70248.1 hypothetical protein SARC_17227 [Sphaeroforma arctica JP610]|eukprot:XP_014144150.1 hypothetical protein SARC_17227 [Sphaeroforma arctica JP610]
MHADAVLEKVVGDGGLALASVGEPIGVGQAAVAGQTGGTNTAVAGSGHLTGTMVVKDATGNPTAGVGGVLIQYQDPATLPRVHKCTYEGCAASFSRGTSLANHSKTHNKERPYECTECGQTFMGPGYLSRHLKIHRKKAERAATLQLNWQW